MLDVRAETSIHEMDSTFGVLFIGYIVAMVMYGLTFFQTYVYFSRYTKDHLSIKILVAGVCATDTATTILISQALYYYLVTLFPFPTQLTVATNTFCAENGLGVFAIFVVQLFYACRVWQASNKSYPLASLISVTSMIAFAFGITMTVHMFGNRVFTNLAQPHMKAAAATSQGIAFLADVLIVVSFSYYMNSKRNPDLRALNGWFDKVVTWGISRGVLFTVVQLAYFVVFITMPSKTYWMPFHHVISKLYINCLLTHLNSREIYCGKGISEEQTLSTVQRSKGGIGISSGGTNSGAGRAGAVRFNIDSKPPLNIEVSQTVEHHSHGDLKTVYDEDIHSFNDKSSGRGSIASNLRHESP